MGLVTPAELASFTDKASKNPRELALYEATDDYLEAYSKHTDLRIKRDGYADAIGGEWETHGPLQLKFLIERGLGRASTLIDFGCGTGRLARHAVRYLEPAGYVGIDISAGALAHVRDLGQREGWADRAPELILGDGTFSGIAGRRVDLIWAHSIFTHLPEAIIRKVFESLSPIEFREFCFTYRHADAPRRSGLKQFQYGPQHLAAFAKAAGFDAEPLPMKWPQSQRTMRLWRR